MYRHILLPTDGSALAREAVRSGMLFARNTDAEVLALYVVPEPSVGQLEAWLHHDPHYAQHRLRLFEKFGDENLQFVANLALAEEVPCIHRRVQEKEPWMGIVKAAEEARCDLIYMASHGWTEDAAGMLGSQTLKVLHHSPVPVLVYKSRPVHGRSI